MILFAHSLTPENPTKITLIDDHNDWTHLFPHAKMTIPFIIHCSKYNHSYLFKVGITKCSQGFLTYSIKNARKFNINGKENIQGTVTTRVGSSSIFASTAAGRIRIREYRKKLRDMRIRILEYEYEPSCQP